jgi:hypothetical protein
VTATTTAHQIPDPAPSWVAAYLVGIAYVALSVAYLAVRVWAW